MISKLVTTCSLAAIVNNSFKQGLFPITLRTAAVKPLVKFDTLNKDLLKNYRAVSIEHSSVKSCRKLQFVVCLTISL